MTSKIQNPLKNEWGQKQGAHEDLQIEKQKTLKVGEMQGTRSSSMCI